ncbi:proton-coupled amino acid transporter-like protein CG1139 [Spodoptera litura]|uniref:Proton-coupled amino acid transporter-like protein CG1139 n=1 Tax=Spodoptera litura TaxID=69820 RepID=A0A9J7DRB8_SPOLT|nr:proton-coupled amino acid transporter-like protein CG1139 [Spodoptera litura]
MAAVEEVSRLMFQPHRTNQTIDIRKTRLPSLRPEENDYNPRDHRSPTHNIKLWMAYFNLLRTMFAAGMLGMPLIISKAGIIAGPILTILTGLLINYGHHLLLECLNEIAKQLQIPYVSYRYGFRVALLHGPPAFHFLGRHGPTIIAIFMVVSQLGTCSVFVIFTSDCLRDIMDWQSSQPSLMCLLFPYFLLEFFMKDLSIVSYVAMLGNFLNVMGIIIVFEHIVTDYDGEDKEVVTHTNLGSIMFCFGSLLFNLSAIGVTLSIDKSLKQAKRITSRFGVLNVGILGPTMFSVFFGTLGYVTFGTMDENILRSLPYDETSSMAAIGFYMIAVASAFPLQCQPAILTIIEVIKYHDQLTTPSDITLRMIDTVARPLFVVTSFIICYIIPFQAPFVAFVGNFCTSVLALICPALMDICIRYPNYYGRNNFHLYKDLFILLLGFTSLSFGAFFSLYLIRIRLLSKYSPNNYGFY